MNTPPKFIPTVESIRLRRERQDDSCKLLREQIHSMKKIESSEYLKTVRFDWYPGWEKACAQVVKRDTELELERLDLEQWEQKFGLK